MEKFQSRVKPWLKVTFGEEIMNDRLERADRFCEESLELLQSANYSKERIHALIDYVYGRDIGEMQQEVGGVMTTLAAFCLAHDIDMHDAADTELERVWTKVDQIRAKQAAKPRGSALPIGPGATGFNPNLPLGSDVTTAEMDRAIIHQYKGDFNSMTDEMIDKDVSQAQDTIDTETAWVEAVAAWKRLGKPRTVH